MGARTLPLWSREETILALWTANSCAGRQFSTTDTAILNLSAQLRAAFPRTGMIDHRFRNPHGVARKVRRFRDLIDGRSRASSSMEVAVWREFRDSPERLARAAQMARARLAIGGAGGMPSRGPVPSRFRLAAQINVDEGQVYLALLDGFVTATDRAYVKVGRTSDVRRRAAELNSAFPAKLGIRWRMIANWRLTDAQEAHRIEQTILQIMAAAGLSAGGEFLLVPAGELERVVDDCRVIAALPPTSGDATSARRAHRGRRKARSTRRRSSRRACAQGS